MTLKQWIIELSMPIFFILVACGVISMAGPMGSEGIFPTMVAGVMMLSAIYIGAEIIIKKQQVVQIEGLHLGKVALAFLILIIYILALPEIGYIISTFLLCAFIIRALGYKNLVWTVIYSLIAVVAVFCIFKVLLNVPLPMILLDF